MHQVTLIMSVHQTKISCLQDANFLQILTVIFSKLFDNTQRVANNFFYERIWTSILFAKDIFYEYNYEYYSWYFVLQIWIWILFVRMYSQICFIKKIYMSNWKYSNPRLLQPTRLKIVDEISKYFFVTFHTGH